MHHYLDPKALDLAAENLGVTSDEALGNRLGMSPQTIRNLRARRVSPSLASLATIAKAAGVPWENAIIYAQANPNAA